MIPTANHDAIATLLQEALDMTTALEEMVRDVRISLAIKENRTNSEALALGLLSRLTNLLKASKLLASAKLPAEIGALGRIIAEASIIAGWVGASDDVSDRDRKFRQFFGHAVLKGEALMKVHEEHGKLLDDAKKAELLNHAEEIRGEFGLGEGEIRALETKIEKVAREASMVKFYDVVYRPLCWDSHPDPRSLIDAHCGYDLIHVLDKLGFLFDAATELVDRCCHLLGTIKHTDSLKRIRARLKHHGLLPMDR